MKRAITPTKHPARKAYTAEETEAMGFSIEEPKRLRSFKSSPYYRCNHS